MKRHILLVLALLLTMTAIILAQSSINHTIERKTISSGGSQSTGNGYALSGSVGQPQVYDSSGNDYRVQSGFWGGIGANSLPSITNTPLVIASLTPDELTPNKSPTVTHTALTPVATETPDICPGLPEDAPPIRPPLTWSRPTEDGQYRVILWNATIEYIYLDIERSSDEICDTTICTLQPDATLLPFGLINGEHELYTQLLPTNTWQLATSFTVNEPPPALISQLEVNPNQGRPTIQWQADSNALYFQVYVGNEQFTHVQWYERTEAMCCGSKCTLKPEIYPPGGEYVVYVQVWGPGGFSPDGIQGWAGPASFSLPSTPPQPVTNPVLLNNQPDFSWQGTANVTWYLVWVGQVAPLQTILLQWYSAIDLNCENAGLCTLKTQLNLPNDTYAWYVAGYGPGGFSQGGDLNGWAGGEFTISD